MYCALVGVTKDWIIQNAGYNCEKKVTFYHQEEFCTSKYFTMHLKRSLVADTIRMILGLDNSYTFNIHVI